MKRGDLIALALSVGVPMVGGQIAGLCCIKDLKGWYKRLKKPRWTPPNWLFGAVWPVLYVGQGVSSWLVWKNKGAKRGLPLGLYAAQLVLNLLWQPLMFKLHRPDLALADSCAMLGLATAATVTMAQAAGDNRAKAAVAGMMSPYVAWLAFATALSAKICKDNPNADKIDATPIPEEPITKKDAVTPQGQASAATSYKAATTKAA